MNELIFGLIVGLFFLLSWVGGSYLAACQTRSLAHSHDLLATENGKLRIEIDELKGLVFRLQSEIEAYRLEIARLSADLDALKPNEP
jgi:cell division protein FtsB